MIEIFKIIFSAFLDGEGKISKRGREFVFDVLFGALVGIVGTFIALLIWVE